jgi:hypothetical protein
LCTWLDLFATLYKDAGQQNIKKPLELTKRRYGFVKYVEVLFLDVFSFVRKLLL